MIARLARGLSWAGAACLVVMMGITVVDVVLRGTFRTPVFGTYDIVEVTLVGVIFLALPEVFLREQHVTVDVIDQIVPPGAIIRSRPASTPGESTSSTKTLTVPWLRLCTRCSASSASCMVRRYQAWSRHTHFFLRPRHLLSPLYRLNVVVVAADGARAAALDSFNSSLVSTPASATQSWRGRSFVPTPALLSVCPSLI